MYSIISVRYHQIYAVAKVIAAHNNKYRNILEKRRLLNVHNTSVHRIGQSELVLPEGNEEKGTWMVHNRARAARAKRGRSDAQCYLQCEWLA